MLTRIIDHLSDAKRRDLACTYGGMGALLLGQKTLGLTLFAKGFAGLERAWRETHEFDGDGAARWRHAAAFYEATHENSVNRALHTIGIPMILGGAAGLLVFKPLRPLWGASAASFTLGWTLNFIGHGVFEKKAPAFADDPLSFVAGPVWDWTRLRALLTGGEAAFVPAAPAAAPTPAPEGEPALAAG